MIDLAIAATATVHGAALFTHNAKDFKIIEDLVDVRAPKGTVSGLFGNDARGRSVAGS